MNSGLLLEDYWHYPYGGARQAHGGWRVAAWPAGQPVHAWPCCQALHTKSGLGDELSTSTVIVPVTGIDVSTMTVQLSVGRATASGKPSAADTCTLVTAMCGKT